ncbi:UPF0146 family protein [Halovenus halobia]|uniref:UPF0146 family protein n=1 Tax=Halovenus halobia TaxID=3396622 RepID=UPI003F563326
MRPATVEALADRLDQYDRIVEIGIGRRPAVAGELAARGVTVTATDIVDRDTPPGVDFYRDDVTDPERSLYNGAEAVFAQNLPPELHRPMAQLAHAVGAECLFTTLGGDPPLVEVRRETVSGETLFVVQSIQGAGRE